MGGCRVYTSGSCSWMRRASAGHVCLGCPGTMKAPPLWACLSASGFSCHPCVSAAGTHPGCLWATGRRGPASAGCGPACSACSPPAGGGRGSRWEESEDRRGELSTRHLHRPGDLYRKGHACLHHDTTGCAPPWQACNAAANMPATQRAIQPPLLQTCPPTQPAIQPAHFVDQVPGIQVGVAHQAARHHCKPRLGPCRNASVHSSGWAGQATRVCTRPARQGRPQAVARKRTRQGACACAAAKLVAAAIQVGEAAALQAAQAAPIGHLQVGGAQKIRT